MNNACSLPRHARSCTPALGEDAVGVLFLDWLRQRLADTYTMPEQTLLALQNLLAWFGCMARARAERVARANALFARIFAGIGPDTWGGQEKGAGAEDKAGK